MNFIKLILSYIPVWCGNSSFSNAELNGKENSDNGADVIRGNSDSLSTLDGCSDSSGRKGITGPYEIINIVSGKLDGQVDSFFGDKAIYIKAIAKVRAVDDAGMNELPSLLCSSVFSSLFESFDLDGFFSSIEQEKIRIFLQSYSASACSFISRIKDVDLRNKAIVEVRSKLNSLISSSPDTPVWELLNLLSMMYCSDVIRFLIGKMMYASCYAYELFKMASSSRLYIFGRSGGLVPAGSC